MSGFSDYTAQAVLNHITGKSAIFSLPTVYVALFTAVGTDAGTGFTEVSGNNYARSTTSASTWNSSSGSAPSSITNALAIAFPTSTGSWGTVIAWGHYDALTGGNLLTWDYIGNFTWNPVTVSLASPGVITSPAHGYSVGDTVIFSDEYGGTAPSFSASNFTGQLVIAHAATDTFDVTNGGTPVNTSSTGSGAVRKISPTVIGTGATPTFSSGTNEITCA